MEIQKNISKSFRHSADHCHMQIEVNDYTVMTLGKIH